MRRFSEFGFRSENGTNSDFRGPCGEEFRSGSGMSEKTSLRRLSLFRRLFPGRSEILSPGLLFFQAPQRQEERGETS